jgi:hypothetical protein
MPDYRVSLMTIILKIKEVHIGYLGMLFQFIWVNGWGYRL